MKFKELKNKGEQELRKILNDLQHSVRELRFKVANDQLKNVRQVREAKKTIARIQTLLNSKLAGTKLADNQTDSNEVK
ncbi:MAG: 50S ribosomal protein L29 [Patescibacteria group bacterium]|jgi:large subunit ribosomal protein L29|nr:50S ribosomal protein L29 [Patescibacteria group bacterium]